MSDRKLNPLPPDPGHHQDSAIAPFASYFEGRNGTIEYRWAEGNLDRLPELASQLVHQQVEVILAGGSTGAQVAKEATSVIPIIAAGTGDLMERGLVMSFARPGGNLTEFITLPSYGPQGGGHGLLPKTTHGP